MGDLMVNLFQLQDNLNVPDTSSTTSRSPAPARPSDLALADLALPANLDSYKVCPRSCYDL